MHSAGDLMIVQFVLLLDALSGCQLGQQPKVSIPSTLTLYHNCFLRRFRLECYALLLLRPAEAGSASTGRWASAARLPAHSKCVIDALRSAQ